MKLLCFDYGEKRTGVAMTDAGGVMAFPRAALLKTSRGEFFDRIAELLEAEKPEALVLGLPLCPDGSEGLTARQVRNFAQSLLRRFPLPVYLMDETLSSAEAESMLRESGQRAYSRNALSPKKKYKREDGRLDSLAAARILESFLNLPPEKRRLAAPETQKGPSA